MSRKHTEDELFLVLARLTEYVRAEAMRHITSAEIRQKLSAHAKAMIELLDEADRKRKWRIV